MCLDLVACAFRKPASLVCGAFVRQARLSRTGRAPVSPWGVVDAAHVSTWRQTWSPSWTAPSTSPDTPDARRHRVPGCASRHSGGPLFHVFHTPQCPWSSLHFINRARAPSLGSDDCFRTPWRHGTRCNLGSSSQASALSW